MLSAPLYFAFGLGTSLVLLVLLLFLTYLSLRQRRGSKGKVQPEREIGTAHNGLQLNARVSFKKPSPAIHLHLANSLNRISSSFDLNTYNRVKKMLEAKEDIKTIARQENLSLGEVKLLESLCK